MGNSGCEYLGYLTAAYSAVWLLLCVYLAVLWRRERQLRREFDALRRQNVGFSQTRSGQSGWPPIPPG